MKQCPKCGREAEDGMFICPYCGEQLYNQDKKSGEFVNVHLARYILLTAVVLPLVGLITGFCLRKKYPLFSRAVMRNCVYGLIVWVMIILLVVICYLAMSSMGVAYT